MGKIEFTASCMSSTSGSAEITILRSAWLMLLQSAAHHARELHQLEQQYGKDHPSPVEMRRHRANSVSAIISSAAAIEAFINEVFLCAVLGNCPHMDIFSDTAKQEIQRTWDNEIERKRILDKYKLAVKLVTDAQPFDKGQATSQAAVGLVSLRNSIMHYKAHTSGDAPENLGTLKDEFRAPFQNPTQPFPNNHLNHGRAEWCVKSAENLIRDFQLRTNMPKSKDPTNPDADWETATK